MTIKYTWIGHGTHNLEIGGKQILVDPFLTNNPSTDVSPDSVEADYILVSHGHGDHVGDLIPVAKRTGATVITNAEISGWLGNQGIAGDKIHAQHIGGGYHHEFGYVKLTIAQHGSGLPDGSCGGNPVGFLITTEGKKIYLACDTGLFSDMQLYGEEGIDLFVLPLGDNFTMGPDDALRAVKLVKPRMTVPTHYNTFPLIEQDAEAWAKRVEAETDTKVHVLQPGDSLEV
jgi:L-ascorbate metabolism protein UlaG (beta-lactamase superfamily)